MKIGIVASEAVPFAKTGGLADVTGALFKIFGELGNETFLFMPLFKQARRKSDGAQKIGTVSVNIGDRLVEGTVYTKQVYARSVAVFIEADEYFGREELYGVKGVDYTDNAERFGFFDRAVLEAIKLLGVKLDVLHLNDWQTGLIPLFLKEDNLGAKSVFTIHNLAYQGNFDDAILDMLHIDRKYYTQEGIEFYGKMSFLKSGLIYSDFITTVSPTYAREILTQQFGERLDGVLNTRKSSLRGILNGIDYEIWNPESDKNIYTKFGSENLSLKEENKIAFLKEVGIQNTKAPLFGMVTRIASQ
ncbi:MAG: glycogen synthase, partial [Caldisericaceae bacterium]